MLLTLALLAVLPGLGAAQTLSLFSDPKAANIGDVLTVIIAENASATNQTATSTDKSNQAQVSSTVPGAGNILSFIPLHSLQSNASNQYQGRASTSRSAQLSARITVTVVGKKPNGDLIIEGSRNLKINGETEAIFLSGTVNPASVAADNTISSSSVGDLQLEYTGKGTLTQGARPGIFVRLLNWVF
ncbi:MAG: flagellar basal body L-ring protein FlgH [Candidatus Latescibacteria bacterium]|nr:flagellar basal body L-ring protein FlgH [Candidatus Latescibacterota bacterium]